MALLEKFKAFTHSEWRGMKPGLSRMIDACTRLGHPEKQFLSLHIAGTNGKGSVAAMLHSILSAAGCRVGLFASPHLVSVNERFRVGDKEILDGELEEILGHLIGAGILTPFTMNPNGGGEIPAPTFFELCTLIAFLYFAQKRVDIAVIEVGLGGRLDATNVITPLVSVLTEISLDHTEILGTDLAAIAREKAGIIKPGVPVVCGATAGEAKKVIEEVAKERGAPVFLVGECRGEPKCSPLVEGQTRGSARTVFNWGSFKNLELGLEGVHQFHNAAIALTTIQTLVGARCNVPLRIDETAIRQGLAQVHWPGRMEWLSRDPPILLDGAHNPAGARALVDSLISLPEPKKWKILFSAAKDKNVEEMLSIFQEIASEITICRMENARTVDPDEIVRAYGRTPLQEILDKGHNAFETYQRLLKELKTGEGLLVTGSLYLVGELKQSLARPTTG